MIILQIEEISMLTTSYRLLETEYKRCLQHVKGNKHFTHYAQEKYRHSMQVMGAGNYLVRRIEWLKNKPKEYIEMVKSTILLHDVYRFANIIENFNGRRDFDHSVEGANFLRQIDIFSDIRVWLPIKHHGHLIEELYQDTEYLSIKDKALQQEVEHICFIVRDADKIANLHMLAYEDNMRSLFLGKAQPENIEDSSISDFVKEDAFKETTIRRDLRTTVADRIASYLSWYMDINYQYSIDFCTKLDVTERLLNMLNEFCSDEQFKRQYLEFFRNYLATHKFLR